MNEDQVLQDLIWRIDAPESEALLLGRRDVLEWPEGLQSRLLGTGLLRVAGAAQLLECFGCFENHVEKPEWLSNRFVISCPEAGLVEIAPEDLEQWQVNPGGFAHAVGAALGCSSAVRMRVPERWWTMGETLALDEPRRVAFCRGWSWGDRHAELVERAAKLGPVDLLIVPRETKIECAAIVLSLEERAEWTDRGLAIGLAGAAEARRSERFLFRASGESRELCFGGGPSVNVRRTKGVEDIALLLSRPNMDIHALALGGWSGAGQGIAPSREEGLSISDGKGVPILDASTMASVRAQIDALEAERSEASEPEKALLLSERRDALREYLTAGTGMDGAIRQTGGQAQRATGAARKRIREAVERIRKRDATLAQHLDQSIRTGEFLSYRPAQPIHWEL